ncbi:Rpn family recombination-promoting nuclease/putative transposase [Planktothrix sp. FACHB-1355]|uniref:Rpn family recombination-promoting nuclease/putative transposase n=1 Tax=Aerosakkonema funiforme FACHB-1375 TaxID=2949571 RepID=A0A926VKW2_9CYAN|nr:Rpn family recombination-promoting nuclease/putative transposase [Aerosakkonema funiforme]MBD2185792.1 Rpn family recombination-promoting nuclease/putative transposase [Aerosakkonema funiforme FACHB-1375]MBD3558871.1 Rpn family recombination-promoting nuclease/putative transposase [Planktothrix sp. FACHB-1355]
MKTDTIFYQLFKEFPNIFFELIGKPDANINAYEFIAPEIKQQSFRIDGLFATLEQFPTEPLYFVEIQSYKDEEFYERLFGEIFVYFRQYRPPNSDWYTIVIYERRSYETPVHPRYRTLVEKHLRCFYLDEIEAVSQDSLGIGILKLIVETPTNTTSRAKELINKATVELTDTIIQRQVLEFIETVVVYKFPNLGREEIEAMLGLNLLRQTRVYQEAREEGLAEGRQEGLAEGRQEGLAEGIEEGKLQTKLEMIPLLLDLGLSIQEVAVRLQLDEEAVRKVVENRS